MDKNITLWIFNNLHESNFINHLFKFITNLGEVGVIWIIIDLSIIIYVALKFKKLTLAMSLSLITLLVGWMINDLLIKPIVNRERPFVELQEVKEFMDYIGYSYPSGASFPSGHAFSSMEQAFILTFYKKEFGFFAIPLAILITFSRVFLGAHYFTDILVGAILGIIFAFVYLIIYRKIIKTQKFQNGKLFK